MAKGRLKEYESAAVGLSFPKDVLLRLDVGRVPSPHPLKNIDKKTRQINSLNIFFMEIY